MTRLTRPITYDEIRFFELNGVVVLRGILDLQTVNALRRSIDDAVNTLAASPQGYDLTTVTRAAELDDFATLQAQSEGQHNVAGIVECIKQSGHPLLIDEKAKSTGSFLLDTGVAARLKAFSRICTRGSLPEIAGTLMQSERVNFFGDQIFVKEPGTREKTAFHQDASYFEIEGEQCCVMWIPVDPVTAATGGMMYVRGSHKDRKLFAPNVFVSRMPMPGSEGDLLPDIDGHLDDYDIMQFDVEPGDMIVHHYRTIHGSGSNLSRYQVRRAASLRYCGEDIRVKTRPGTPRQMHHTQHLNDGDELQGLDFPVVWRRPAATKKAA